MDNCNSSEFKLFKKDCDSMAVRIHEVVAGTDSRIAFGAMGVNIASAILGSTSLEDAEHLANSIKDLLNGALKERAQLDKVQEG